MKPRENPFRISALNSLRVNEIPIQNQKQLNNTFKGGNDLRTQLNKQKQPQTKYNQTLQPKQQQKQFMSTMKPESQALMDEVAALDNFKLPVTRDKTKQLIQTIKLRRRQQHIEAYNNFKQDLQDYKENLHQIYASLFIDCQQVLTIKQQQLQGYLNSQSDEYLLSRERQVLSEFNEQLRSFILTTREKLTLAKEELQRLRGSRLGVVDDTCEMLRMKLVDVAFVLELQAKDIADKEKMDIEVLETKVYERYYRQLEELSAQHEASIARLETRTAETIKRWRELKQHSQITAFQSTIHSEQYINPQQRQQLYTRIIQLQQDNHNTKQQCLSSIIQQEHVDSLRKQNVDRWLDMLKGINQQFGGKLDTLVSGLMVEYEGNKQVHQRLVAKLEERMCYIGNHNEEEVKEMMERTYRPMGERNNMLAQQLMKAVTTYVQYNDQRQTSLLQKLGKFFTTIADTNDNFVKDFNNLSQKHQLQQAKILDDDEELVQKLTMQLQQQKKMLRESLHHLKLEQIEQKCFAKIDQIEIAYRKTHQQNKSLTAARPQLLSKFMQDFEAKIATVFELYPQSKRAELVERNKQDMEKQAIKRIEQEDKLKLQEEEKQLEIIKKNGGKVPPAPKPKDPKKLAAEIQERKKVILAQLGEKKVQEVKTGVGNTWLVYKSLDDIAAQFYKSTALQTHIQGQIQQVPALSDPPTALDKLPPAITNPLGHAVTTSTTLLTIPEVSSYLLTLRSKLFQNIITKRQRIFTQSQEQDEQMMSQSLTMLDNRLKRHYSLKGQLQAEIFVKRSGEITNHKKRYEKYARMIRERMDVQTERINFLLEKGLQMLKTHNQQQKQLKDNLPQAKNLSQLQGILSKARQNTTKFTIELNQLTTQLHHLSGVEVQLLLQKNTAFIKESRPLTQGGEYSQDQIKWYTQMMNEITTQLKSQQSKRQQKSKEVYEQCEKRKKELIEKIQKQYNLQIEQLSAKQGTGKVYGKPKRTAQEKIRLEMNKCQQAQISIDRQVSAFVQLYHTRKAKCFRSSNRPDTLQWRRQLMTIFTCIQKYARHLQALRKDTKLKPMQRVNYDQSIAQSTVVSQQDDKKLLQKEIKQLGPLGEQKEDKPFTRFITDIEKIISDESRATYIGDKAKYLTGVDKLPDFLRKYIAQMRQSTEDFRQASIRQLRDSCVKLAEFCSEMGEMFFTQIGEFFCMESQAGFNKASQAFANIITKHELQRTQHLRMLRPNLANPKCQGQLAALNSKEDTRQTDLLSSLTSLRQEFKSSHFINGQKFIICLINNYEFLIQYVDSLLLFQDFTKIIGDDDQNKQKLNVKKLMIMKQTGVNVDSASQRNIVKKWPGVDFTIVNFDDMKFVYKKPQVQDVTKDIKKGAKKQTKKNETIVQPQIATTSRQLQTFKTWRQKAVYEHRNKCMEMFMASYTTSIAKMYADLDEALKDNLMFVSKWRKIADELVMK